MKQTYLRRASSPLNAIRELYALYLFTGKNLEKRAADITASTRAGVKAMEEFSGEKLESKKVLEIGPGQTKPYYYALGAKNDYTAIDLEIPPDGISAKELFRVLKENGMLRATKTLGRHVLGIDKGLAKALAAEFGGTPNGRFLQGDASATDFPTDHFDYIMSASVFEHLPDPAKVMTEITRILKPGATVFTITHIFTSISGAHDPRVFVDFEALPVWAHLNPREKAMVQSNSYLNELRISNYLKLFDTIWPGCQHEITGDQIDRKRALMDTIPDNIRENYTAQELLSDVIITLWKKPIQSAQIVN